jgi:CRISPR/Cas system-associated exonuclease Cas4 (RecB family)
MLETFLEKSARYIFEKYADVQVLESLCIVVPTRRAGYFFKRALAQCSNRPFLAPEVVAIDDFVSQRCGVEISDNVSLLFELYDIFKQVDKNITFDRYLQWGTMLLRDFDQIDQFLVDSDYLFNYITEAKAIERWQVDWPKSRVSAESERIKGYFELFSNLLQVYQLFRQDLQSRHRAYRGMAYRQLAENAFELLLNSPESTDGSPQSAVGSRQSAVGSRQSGAGGVLPDSLQATTHYYFIGFNALSAAEETIIRTLIKAKRAEILWDSDFYYMRENPYAEGGKSLRKYREAAWSGEWKWTENHLLGTPKDIHVYAVPNASMQAKVAGELYRQWCADEQGGTEKRPVGIVLADENLLVPMLNGLDEAITDLNVTMGLTLRNSLLFTLVDALFELQFTMAEFRSKDGRNIKIPKFNHRTVQKVLSHPFIRRYEFLALQHRNSTASSIIQTTIREIQQRNLVYLDPKQLFEWGENHPLFKALFTRWDDNPHTVIKALYTLIDLLREVYKDTQNAIETEYLYLFYTLLKQLESTLSNEHVEKLNLRTFKAFLYELIRQTRIPFSGEPVSPLQIIGMLETRALDFERIIILSMNEGVFPATKRQNSLIPWDIAREAGLPVYSDQDAVMSYHFYRLLQRAHDVHLVYVTDPNTYNGGEKSRFILQLEHELVPKANGLIKFQEHVVMFQESPPSAVGSRQSAVGSGRRSAPQSTESSEQLIVGNELETVSPKQLAVTDWTVPKTPEILTFLRGVLVKEGLYATHLNQYLKCSLQYYFSRVAGVAEDEEVEERMGAADFGSWIHKVLERIDIEYLMDNKPISDEQVKAILREEFEKMFRGYDADSGINRLLYQVAEQTVVDFLREQRNRDEGLVVLATEQKLMATIDVLLGAEVLTVKIAGKIDRVELLGNTIRVADYKTGKIEQLPKVTPEKLESIMTSGNNSNHEKIRQLWLYQYLIYKQMLRERGLRLRDKELHLDNYEVTSGFYSLRNIKRGFIQNPLRFDESTDAESYVANSEKYIQAFVTDKLLNPDEPFRKTDHLMACQYCDFREICGR